MLLFLIFLGLSVSTHMLAEGEGGKRGVKENFFVILTCIFGAIAIYFAISSFLYDSFQPVSPYDFHW